ncbi:MAG: hypothetical protein DCC75_00850 [Proteobacteria bacterium]|nr:MAG: hypothetical protein DCC75_00850 [Pseudomonadota bacterium]
MQPVIQTNPAIQDQKPYLEFQSLRGVPPDEIMHPRNDDLPLKTTLREIALLTKRIMEAMNESYPGLPNDSIERTLQLVTQPGAKVVVWRGKLPALSPSHQNEDQILGYGIIINGVENFPDRDVIPSDLLRDRSASRVIRLFVHPEVRDGEPFNYIIEQIQKLAGKGPAIGMVLTDILPQRDGSTDHLRPDLWLKAKTALETRGFEDTGIGLTEHVRHQVSAKRPKGCDVDIAFRWYVWPPFSDHGRRLAESFKARFADMKASFQGRFAWLAPYLPLVGGRILFCGTSKNAATLAKLYSGNTIVWDPAWTRTTADTTSKYPPDNMRAARADLQDAPLPAECADSAVVYGLMPDVLAGADQPFQFKIKEFLKRQVDQLKPGGTLIIRDTMLPPGAPDNLIATFSCEQLAQLAEKNLSQLFAEFIAARREPHIAPSEWDSVVRLESDDPETTTWRAPAVVVSEFLLKCAWAQDWDAEGQRPYCAATPDLVQQILSELGMKIITVSSERNSWIAKNFYDPHVSLSSLSGQKLELPPNNFVIVAEKAEDRFRAVDLEEDVVPEFLSSAAYLHGDPVTSRADAFREIISRPNLTHDIVLYDVDLVSKDLKVLVRQYPRPIAGRKLVEQISAIAPNSILQGERILNDSALKIARDRAGVSTGPITRFHNYTQYFTRADMIDELVVAQAVQFDAASVLGQLNLPCTDQYPPHTVRMIGGKSLLQACHMGGSQDARVERKLYELFELYNLNFGPWLGERTSLSVQDVSIFEVSGINQILNPPRRKLFKKEPDLGPSPLKINRATFEQQDAAGRTTFKTKLEYALLSEESGFGTNSVSILPVLKRREPDGRERIYVGLELYDFPAVQERTGSSAMFTIPTLHLPAKIPGASGEKEFAKDYLKSIGIETLQVATHGGSYFTSPGVTPELIQPLIAEVNGGSSRFDSLCWIPLEELRPHIHKLHCAQAITSLYRAAHALMN